MSALIIEYIYNGYREYTINGYTAYQAKPTSRLECPHCAFKHNEYTKDFCVPGRPDNSKHSCDNCNKPIAVVFQGNSYYVVKLYHIEDNIN